jgi:hypothetical protein
MCQIRADPIGTRRIPLRLSMIGAAGIQPGEHAYVRTAAIPAHCLFNNHSPTVFDNADGS